MTWITWRGVEETFVIDYSKIRQRMDQLRREEQILLERVMRPPKMVRGSITWHGKQGECAESSPGLNRKVGGKSIGRRVRMAHLDWLPPLLEAYRKHRQSIKKLQAIHKEMVELADRLRYERMYDYEPTIAGHLLPVVREGKDGQEE